MISSFCSLVNLFENSSNKSVSSSLSFAASLTISSNSPEAKHVYEKVGFVETDVVDEPDCHEVNMLLKL